MNSSKIGRRRFLLGAGLGLGTLLARPAVVARAEGGKVAIPLAKLELLKSVGGSIAIKVYSAPATRRSSALVTARSSTSTGMSCTGPRRGRSNVTPQLWRTTRSS